jgi:uncharacterized protein (DUF58 family)
MDQIRSLLTTDFCPWANRYVYWMKQPLGWYALGAFASLLIGMFVSPSGWTMLACCIVVIAIQLAWPWVQMRMCRCEVSFDRNRATEWSENIVRVKVTNRGPFPLWGLAIERGFFLADHETSETSGAQVAVTLSRVPAFSTNSYAWKFVPHRRGVYPLDTPRLSTAFPFGIWTAHKEVEVKGRLLIWPQTTQLHGLPLVDATGIAPLGAMRDRPGDQGDILGSRVWQPGESLRMVNWAQTSRTEEDLIVLERQSCARPCVQVLIDLMPHPEPTQRQRVTDWQVRIAATLAEFFHGHQFDLRGGYAIVNRVIGSSRAGIHAWFDELARLIPDEHTQPLPTEPSRNRQTFLVANFAGWQASSQGDSNAFLILVATQADSKVNLFGDRGFVIELDDDTHDPFTQLATQWRACQRAQQTL